MSPVLVLHVSAGAVAILTGFTALLSRKGERLHRAFGTLFVSAMLTLGGSAAVLAALVPDRANMVGGLFAIYLAATAWMTVRRPAGSVGLFEYGALIVGVGCAAAFLGFGVLAATDPGGRFDRHPAALFFTLGALLGLAALGDLRLIRAGGVVGTRRIVRHLWRMCASLFIATGSFFIGQQKVMPEVVRGSPALYLLGLAPLAFLVLWLIYVRRTRFGAAISAEAG